MQEITNDTILFGYNPEIGYVMKQSAKYWALTLNEAFNLKSTPFAISDLMTEASPWSLFLTEREAEKAFFDEMYSLEAFLHFCKDSGYNVTNDIHDLWFELYSTKTMCVTLYDFFKSDRVDFYSGDVLGDAVLVKLLDYMGMEVKDFKLVVKDLPKLHGYLAHYIRKQQKRIIASSLEKKKNKLQYVSVAEFDKTDGCLKVLTSKEVPLWKKFVVIQDESIILSAKSRDEMQEKIKTLGSLIDANVEVFELKNRKIDKVSIFDFPKNRMDEIFPKKAITWEVMNDLQEV